MFCASTAQKDRLTLALEETTCNAANEAAERASACETVVLLAQRVCRVEVELSSTRCCLSRPSIRTPTCLCA